MTTLAFREVGLAWDEASLRVLALGDREHVPLEWLGALLSHCSIRILEAPRRAEPRRLGVETVGGDWYVAGVDGPDPHAFHLSLIALESLVQQAPGVTLVGLGQGSALCLSLACCWPERLTAVVAYNGALPAFLPGALEEREMAGLPFLCVPGRDAQELIERGGQVQTLEAWDELAVKEWVVSLGDRASPRGLPRIRAWRETRER